MNIPEKFMVLKKVVCPGKEMPGLYLTAVKLKRKKRYS